MQLYDCKVRLHGSLYNEVRRFNVTAAEIAVLKILHGDDSVVEIEPKTFDRKRDDVGERDRLTHLYGPALAKVEDVKTLNGVFGVAGALPKYVPGMEPSTAAQPSRGRRRKSAGAAPAPAQEPSDEPEDLDDLDELEAVTA